MNFDNHRITESINKSDGSEWTHAVLAIARNVVSAIRLLDVLDVFLDDPRISINFTVAPGSKFESGTRRFLERFPIHILSWSRACSLSFSLAIATSPNGDLHRVAAPILLLPHGAGFNKLLPGGQGAPTGLAASQLMRAGRVVPDVIGLEHPDQLGRLEKYCPEASRRTVVMGDPCRDRLAADVNIRQKYRDDLGVSENQRLVVLSSTWGGKSLFESYPGLPARLIAELPSDEFRLMMIIHPNVHAVPGAEEIRRRLATALRAGLVVVPPEEWESAVLAADLVIGDHGSVMVYAAAIRTPAMFGSYDADQIDPESPMAALRMTLPQLCPNAALEPAVRSALEQRTDAAAYLAADAAFANHGRSMRTIQRVAYDMLKLHPRGASPCHRSQS